MAKGSKLTFHSQMEGLKTPVYCNSIPQVLLHFNYVERWGNADIVKYSVPEDSKNVTDFFSSIRKLSDTGFQAKKFNELWEKYNMCDITDYKLEIDGAN